MGYSIGYNKDLDRDIGYGVPAYCDHPDCKEFIDRGMSYACGHYKHDGCGMHFCPKHLHYSERRNSDFCHRCYHGRPPFTPKPDCREWVEWKLNDESWQEWRDKNPDKVKTMKEYLASF